MSVIMIREIDLAACRHSGAAFVVEYIGFIASNSYFQGHGYHPARGFELPLIHESKYENTKKEDWGGRMRENQLHISENKRVGMGVDT